MCVCPPSYQDRHHAVLLTRCLPASPPSPCRPTAMPSCDTHALSMVRAHVCAFSCLSVPVRFRPMCVSSVLFLVDFFVHASPHQLWRHCRNFLEQQTGFLSQRTAFVCVVSVFIAVGFKNLLNPAKVKYHHLQTPPSYLFFILTRAAPPPLLSSPCVPSRCPRLFLLPRFWQAPCFCSVILPSHVGSASLQQPWFCCLFWCALPTEHEYEKLPPSPHTPPPPPSPPSLTLAPLHPTSCLHRADLRLAWMPVLVSFSPYFSPSLFYSRLCLPPSSSSSSLSLWMSVQPWIVRTQAEPLFVNEWRHILHETENVTPVLINIDSSAWRQAVCWHYASFYRNIS